MKCILNYRTLLKLSQILAGKHFRPLMPMVSSLLNHLRPGKKGARKPKSESELRQDFDNSIPIASVLMERGFYTFDSESSYEDFKRNNSLGYRALDFCGKGIPTLYITDDATSLGKWKGDRPHFLVFKFLVLPSEEAGPSENCHLEAEKNGLCLYRIPLCTVYRRNEVDGMKYIFSFFDVQDRAKNFTMKCLSTSIADVKVRWQDRKSIMGEYDDYSLRAMNQKSIEDEPEPLIAYYSRANRDHSDLKSFKQATLYVGNKTSESLLPFTPQNIELITYQALLVHYLEYHERKRKANRSYFRSFIFTPYAGL